MRPGARVAVAGPLGEFCAPPDAPGKRLLLSGGSGVTPLISMARAAYDLGAAADIVFVHAARSPDDILFRAELAAMARHWPGLRTAFVCEADSPGRGVARPSRPPLACRCCALIAPDFLEREVFCCGPAPFMAAVRAMLDGAGFDRARYHEESFDFAALSETEQQRGRDRAEAEVLPAGFSVRVRQVRPDHPVPADQHRAGRRARGRPPAAAAPAPRGCAAPARAGLFPAGWT